MVNSPSEILALTNEPAVLVCHGRIQYANSCACTILGPGCHGRTVREIFGADIAEAQAGAFISGVRLCGKQYALRVSPMEDSYVYFFSLQDTGAEYMNDAFLYSLRSSLSGLSVAAERIRELAENTDEEITACINGITHSYYKLSRLIRNVSAIREASRGGLIHETQIFDLAELCRSFAHTTGILKSEEHIIFGYEGSLAVRGDPAVAELLLENLISNCILHARGHSRITINLLDMGDTAVLSVSDDGCGIPSDLLPKVFERYRYGFELSEMGRGSGFGLSAALAAAEHHGGTLLLESRLGYGTSVRASMKKNGPIELSGPTGMEMITMQDVLTGLADCLPDTCFGAEFMD